MVTPNFNSDSSRHNLQSNSSKTALQLPAPLPQGVRAERDRKGSYMGLATLIVPNIALVGVV